MRFYLCSTLSINLSLDEKWVTSLDTTKRILKLWEIHSNTYRTLTPVDGGTISDIKISHNNAWVMAATDGGTLNVWDIQSGNLLYHLHIPFPINSINDNRENNSIVLIYGEVGIYAVQPVLYY